MFRLFSAFNVTIRNICFYALCLQAFLKGYDGLLVQGFLLEV